MSGSELVIYAGRQPRERYLVDGRPGVGVSTVLVESGARLAPAGPLAAVRAKAFVGSLVHALIAGWWDEPSMRLRFEARVKRTAERRRVDWRPETIEAAAPYWESFLRLLGMARMLGRLWEHEVVVVDRPLVCGTFDYWGDFGRRRVLLDWKTRPPLKQGETLQTIAYLEGLRRQWPDLEPTARATISLRRGADPKIIWHHDDAAALAAWCRAVERWTDLRATADRSRSGRIIEPTEESHDGEAGEAWPGDESDDDGPGAEDRGDDAGGPGCDSGD